jgi:uncharacterized protein with HEPN domain
MSERNDNDYLKDILEAARRAVAFSSGLDFPTFQKDLKTQDVVKNDLPQLISGLSVLDRMQ